MAEDLPPLDDIEGLESAFENVADEGVDLTALLVRRFTWDTLPCEAVPDLLVKMGLPPGGEEGSDIDHAESHRRMSQVYPLEMYLDRFSAVVGTVLTEAMTDSAGVDLGDDTIHFAEQNKEVILSGARAIIGQLMHMGLIVYGPLVQFVADDGDGNVLG